jgi:hypothetical protein
MSYMGYHPERIRHLATRLRAAGDELARLTSNDPEAAAALAVVRQSRSTLEHWLPMVSTIAGCGVLTDRPRIVIDGSDIRFARAHDLQQQGWSFLADVGEMPAPSLLDLQAVLARVRAGHVDTLLDTPEERAWLRSALAAVAADPTQRANLAELLDDDEIAALADGLARHWLDVMRPPVAADAGPRLDDLTATFASLGRVISAPPDRPITWAPTLFDSLIVDAAVLLLPYVSVGASARAEIAERTIARIDEQFDRYRPHARGFDPAAALLEHLATRPEAATLFLLGIADQPAIVADSSTDPDVVRRLMETATDPGRVSVEDAGRILVPFLEAAMRYDYYGNPIMPSTAAALLAPWLRQLGPRAHEWAAVVDGFNPTRGTSLLRWMLDNQLGRDTLQASFDRLLQTTLIEPLLDERGRLAEAVLDDLAGVYWQVAEALRSVEVAAERGREVIHAIASTIVDALVGSAKATGPTGIVVGVVVGEALRRITDALGLRPDADRLDDDLDLANDVAAARIAVAAAQIAVASLIDQGLLRWDLSRLDRLDHGVDVKATFAALDRLRDDLRDDLVAPPWITDDDTWRDAIVNALGTITGRFINEGSGYGR